MSAIAATRGSHILSDEVAPPAQKAANRLTTATATVSPHAAHTTTQRGGGGAQSAPAPANSHAKRRGKEHQTSADCPAPSVATRKSPARKAVADPFGILKAVAGVRVAQTEKKDELPADNAELPSITSLLEASSTWACSDIYSAGYSSLAEVLKAGGAGQTAEDMEEQCPKCEGRMHMFEHEMQCSSCQYVLEGDSTLADPADDDAPARRQPQTGRLRIVGPNSGHYQPDLDRSSSTNYAATQRKQVYEEYLMYRQAHIEAGGSAFPLNVLERAADIYHEIQQQVTKRSQSKKRIMASCLQIACIEKGFAPKRPEIAQFMRLETKGTAQGENFIRKMKADGCINVDVNKDTCAPHIVTTFALLGLDTPDYLPLQKVVEKVVKTSIADAVGISSVIRTKAMGATYIVLRRYAMANGNKPVPLTEFCTKCEIRKNTVERYSDQLAEYHSHFEGIYKEAGIFSTPLNS